MIMFASRFSVIPCSICNLKILSITSTINYFICQVPNVNTIQNFTPLLKEKGCFDYYTHTIWCTIQSHSEVNLLIGNSLRKTIITSKIDSYDEQYPVARNHEIIHVKTAQKLMLLPSSTDKSRKLQILSIFFGATGLVLPFCDHM